MVRDEKERATNNACVETESYDDEGVLSRGARREGAYAGSS